MKYALFFAFALFICLPAQAGAPVIGHVVEVDGSVMIGGTPLAIDDPIHLNDTLSTGAGARALIVFADDTQITLGENSQIKIDEYIYDADTATPDKGHFSILQGAFLFTSGLINQSASHDTQIETPYGSIGLRGTTIWGGPLDGQYAVLVQDGSVVCENEAGMVAVEKNEMSFLADRKQMPVRITNWTPGQIQRAMSMVALKNPEAVKQRVMLRKQANIQKRLKMKAERLKRGNIQGPIITPEPTEQQPIQLNLGPKLPGPQRSKRNARKQPDHLAPLKKQLRNFKPRDKDARQELNR